MKKSTKVTIMLLILSAISLAVIFYFYPSLPNKIPSSIGFDGTVNDYSDKNQAIIFALVPFAITLLLPVIKKIDPSKENFAKFENSFLAMQVIAVLTIIIMNQIMILSALGYINNVEDVMLPILAIMMIVMGNIMPKFKHNYFIGIRTPWTLASNKSWQKTNRLGGYYFTAIGVLTLLVYLIYKPWVYYFLFASIILTSLHLAYYSYKIFIEDKDKIKV